MPKALLTGSRVYGTPRLDSDIDLVVLMDKVTYLQLAERSERGPVLRFGALNIIPVEDEKQLGLWQRGTAQCLSEAPCSRVRAKVIFNALGVTGEVSG